MINTIGINSQILKNKSKKELASFILKIKLL